jgi:hypothetical protein
MSTPKKSKLYKTQNVLKRRLRIAYPSGNGRLVLRTEHDWDKDVEAIETSEDGTTWTFELEADEPFLYFKTCLIRNGEFHWSIGPNKLLLMEESEEGTPCRAVGPTTGIR